MIKVFASILFAALLFSAESGSLSLREAIISSLTHCPANEIAASAVQTQGSAVMTARSPLFPQLSATGQGNLAGGPGTSGQVPALNPQAQFYTGLALSQMLFDFGKTPAKLKAARRSYNAALQDSGTTAQSIILSTIQAYCAVLAAADKYASAKDAFDAAQKHCDLAKAKIANGTGTTYGTATADYTLAMAKLAVIRAADSSRIAAINFDVLVGIASDTVRLESVVPGFDTTTVSQMDDSADAALIARRPDHQAAAERVEAARLALASVKSGYLPTFSATAAYGYRAVDPYSTANKTLWVTNANQPSWSAGASLSMPIFSGFSVQASIGAATASLHSALAALATIDNAAKQELLYARSGLTETALRLEASRQAYTAATLARDIAAQRLANGSGDPLLLADAEAAYENSKFANIQAGYDLFMARARYEKACGRLLPDFK